MYGPQLRKSTWNQEDPVDSPFWVAADVEAQARRLAAFLFALVVAGLFAALLIAVAIESGDGQPVPFHTPTTYAPPPTR